MKPWDRLKSSSNSFASKSLKSPFDTVFGAVWVARISF